MSKLNEIKELHSKIISQIKQYEKKSKETIDKILNLLYNRTASNEVKKSIRPIFLTHKRLPHQKNNNSNGEVIQVIKNKKIVYCQQNNSISFNHNISKIKEVNEIHLEENEKEKNYKKGKRGSKYRGVSKNGNQWQVLIMVNKKKRYIGNYKTEDEAAISYDTVAIQNHGEKAKTNFFYTPEEYKKIKQDKKITWKM